MCKDTSPERVQAQVPDGHDGGVLKDVGAIEKEENAASHDHLLAVRHPAFVHLLHEDQLVQALAQELFKRLLHMVLNQLLETRVNLYKK